MQQDRWERVERLSCCMRAVPHDGEDFDDTRPGDRIDGPAIVEQIDATTIVEPNAIATVDAIGNLRIRVAAGVSA